MKRAYLVVGAESSGTRMLTSILIAGGCTGSPEHFQPYDRNPPTADRIVWRRSIPHAGTLPQIGDMAKYLEGLGYVVTAIFITRDWHATIHSQLKGAQHAKTAADAVQNIVNAYAYSLAQFVDHQMTFIVVSYEQIVYSDLGTRILLKMLDLDETAELPKLYNGNLPYYKI